MYDAWWVDEPLWTQDVLPKIGQELTAENMDNLKGLIDSCLEDSRYAEGRRIAKEETWMYREKGAERTVEYLLDKYEKLKEMKEDK